MFINRGFSIRRKGFYIYILYIYIVCRLCVVLLDIYIIVVMHIIMDVHKVHFFERSIFVSRTQCHRTKTISVVKWVCRKHRAHKNPLVENNFPLVFKHVRLIKISYCCLYPDISIKSTWAVKSSCLSDGAEGTLNASPPQKMNKWILSVAHMICQNKHNVGFTQCPKTIPNSTIKGWLSTIPSHRWFVALAFPDYSRYPFFI